MGIKSSRFVNGVEASDAEAFHLCGRILIDFSLKPIEVTIHTRDSLNRFWLLTQEPAELSDVLFTRSEDFWVYEYGLFLNANG